MSTYQQDGRIGVIESQQNFQDPDDDVKVDKDVLCTKFKKFIRESQYRTAWAGRGNLGAQKYRSQFQQNCNEGHWCLEVSLDDLSSNQETEVLVDELRRRPTEIIPLFEEALKDLYKELVKDTDDDLPSEAPQIQLTLLLDADLEGTLGKNKIMKIRELRHSQVERLVVIQGIVVSAKAPNRKANRIVLKCSKCENIKEIAVPSGKSAVHIPSNCDGNSLQLGRHEKCPPNPFIMDTEMSCFVDEQVLVLQELPEDVPVGEMPRTVDLHVQQYLVDKCPPGTRLTAIGVYVATEREVGASMTSGRSGKVVGTVKYSYVQTVGIHVAQGNIGSQADNSLTKEQEEQCLLLSKDPDVKDKIFKSIAPSICASSKDCIDHIKKAIACLLFGGSMKRRPDNSRTRGDINILLLGDPGTAKSQFLKFVDRAAPIAVYTSGKGSSAAGLTAAVVRDNNGFNLEGGAMVLADNGIVCIDEFDKMDVNDRVAIHEAMEQQTISIAKAGLTVMLNTRCSVLAAANPRFGTHDDLTSTTDQIDFEATILSRFDMIFLVKDVRDAGRDIQISRHIAALHKGDVQEVRKGPLSPQELRSYIKYVKQHCQPRIMPEAGAVLQNHYVKIRKAMREEKGFLPITVRQLEAIIRISESLAKMEMREEVTVADVEEALNLFTVSTCDASNRDRADIGIAQMSDEEKKELQAAQEQLRKLIPRGGRKNKFQMEQQLVAVGNVSEQMARRAIHLMTMSGELEERQNNTLRRKE